MVAYFHVSQKEIRELSKCKTVTDLTHSSFDEINDILSAHTLHCLAISRGTYGMNGAWFIDESGHEYCVTRRTNALFQLV